jgi:hypothetical protein
MKQRSYHRAKLNNLGLAHYILPLIVIVLVGVVGTALLVNSNAATKRPKLASVSFKIIYPTKCYMPEGWGVKICSLGTSRDDLLVHGMSGTKEKPLLCNGKDVNYGVNFGRVRKLKCTPGAYHFTTASAAEFPYSCREDKCSTQKEANYTLELGDKFQIKLGSMAKKPGQIVNPPGFPEDYRKYND